MEPIYPKNKDMSSEEMFNNRMENFIQKVLKLQIIFLVKTLRVFIILCIYLDFLFICMENQKRISYF